MVRHQAVKRAVPGLNPASFQPAGTCHSLLGSQQGWHDNCRLASEGQQRQKNTKIQKKIIRNFFLNCYRRKKTKFIEKKFQQHAITYTGH